MFQVGHQLTQDARIVVGMTENGVATKTEPSSESSGFVAMIKSQDAAMTATCSAADLALLWPWPSGHFLQPCRLPCRLIFFHPFAVGAAMAFSLLWRGDEAGLYFFGVAIPCLRAADIFVFGVGAAFVFALPFLIFIGPPAALIAPQHTLLFLGKGGHGCGR